MGWGWGLGTAGPCKESSGISFICSPAEKGRLTGRADGNVNAEECGPGHLGTGEALKVLDLRQ